MKTISITCLLILFVHPAAFGVTNCKIVEYPDHVELICIGDEKAQPESIVPAIPAQPKTVETIAQNQEQPRSQMPEPASSTVKSQPSAAPSGTASQQTNEAANNADKNAENLAKRRELATRNTSKLKNITSATVPSGK